MFLTAESATWQSKFVVVIIVKDFKTIGEVSSCTGIEKRKLKYYIEQELIKPSLKDPNNDRYWLYSKEDIEIVQRIALYDELGYKSQEIKAILNDPTFEWQNELDKLIPKLQERRKRIDYLLLAAECIRWIDRMEQGQGEFDISSFDGNIEKSIQSIFEYTSKKKKRYGRQSANVQNWSRGKERSTLSLGY